MILLFDFPTVFFSLLVSYFEGILQKQSPKGVLLVIRLVEEGERGQSQGDRLSLRAVRTSIAAGERPVKNHASLSPLLIDVLEQA